MQIEKKDDKFFHSDTPIQDNGDPPRVLLLRLTKGLANEDNRRSRVLGEACQREGFVALLEVVGVAQEESAVGVLLEFLLQHN